MAYTLKKLNVVKVVESKLRRDALLDKGFEIVEQEEKKPTTKATKQIDKTADVSAKQVDQTVDNPAKQDEKAGGDM